jgi:hypothetical protein
MVSIKDAVRVVSVVEVLKTGSANMKLRHTDHEDYDSP